MFLDELQLSTELTEAGNNAFALPSEKVNKEAMYFGILTNKILPGATVLGFSRSGHYMNKEFLDNDSKVYSIVDVVMDDHASNFRHDESVSIRQSYDPPEESQLGLSEEVQLALAIRLSLTDV